MGLIISTGDSSMNPNFIRVTNSDTLKIYSALEKADIMNDEHWSSIGEVSVDYVKKTTGLDWVNRRVIDYASSLWIGSYGVIYELKNPNCLVDMQNRGRTLAVALGFLDS
jgi:hypothetical protein